MTQSLDKILGEFNATEPSKRETLTGSRAVTILLLPTYKERYDALQKKSGGQFHKKLRELIQAAIDQVEAKAV